MLVRRSCSGRRHAAARPSSGGSARPPLADRLRPYVARRRRAGRARGGLLSVASFREVIGPLAAHVGERLARLLGVDRGRSRVRLAAHPLADRRHRASASASSAGRGAPRARRRRSLTVAAAAPVAVALLVRAGAPLLAFLVARAAARHALGAGSDGSSSSCRSSAEQLGMLLSARATRWAPRSTGSPTRGHGACAERPRPCRAAASARASPRSRPCASGPTVAEVDAVDRLVAVLALNREAGDLGRLISEEARAIRRDVHRELIETIERRGQQVWIPVTVATLVPGVDLPGRAVHRGAAAVLRHLTDNRRPSGDRTVMPTVLHPLTAGRVRWPTSRPARAEANAAKGSSPPRSRC